MQYEISTVNDTVTVKFEGTLSALDLIFMNQDPSYRQALNHNTKLFLDFSQIVGSTLTAEDTTGLALLGKRDAEKATNIHLVILLGYAEAESIGMVLKTIFAGSTWKVTVAETRDEARQALQQ
ncbi:MAG: hypothetical protein NWQ54_04930 [Paraglaciecola sp.]|uniref:hypothetical protein n=1 Tax=Paraglaciecola sp. TaxID=1920173 RepID=UPI0027400FAF|nr:hypothetical protein [Paraglaciecola sp.]MDP5033152.1 hypothetical protein [Paraglaciecola sp.]MDP5130202.1 hypothetical protein [Paraglaciecola sp.]